MKKTFCTLMAFLMFFACALPAAADNYEAPNTEKELKLEYMEFYENQEYYKTLAKNEGYRLVISVGKEYEDLETARLEAEAQEIDELVPGTMARGTEVPTKKYNVAKKQYNLAGLAVQSTLYTQKNVYGATYYEMSIHNRYKETSKLMLKVTTNGYTKSGDTDFYVNPGETVIQYGRTHYTSELVYLKFRAPVSVEGYIKNAE